MRRQAVSTYLKIAQKVPLLFIYCGGIFFYSVGMYKYYNPNKLHKTEDCTVRALSKALGIDWRTAFMWLSNNALRHWDMMHKNYVWGDLLEQNGFKKAQLPNSCPRCYTVAEFARDNPDGVFVLGTGSHVVTVIDGDWFDMWDSGNEVPIIVYWRRE